jgi:hypothetical protein
MTIRDLIQSKLEQLDEAALQEIYTFVQEVAQKQANLRPGLLSKLREIKIDAPSDFATNLDSYLNAGHNDSARFS